MKKYLKRVKALLIAAIALIVSVIPKTDAAAAPAPTTSLVISGVEAGCNVYAYAVAIDAEDAEGNHYWKYNPAGTVEERVTDGNIDAGDIIYFYTHLNTGSNWDAHDGEGEAVVDKTVLGPATYDSGTETYTIANVKPGLYVIAANKEIPENTYTGNAVPVNYQYDSNGVASIADTAGVINVTIKKAGQPTMNKQVVEAGTPQKHGDANIGDVVDFQIALNIPDYTGAWQTGDNLHFIISDALSSGLTLDPASIKLEGTDIATLFDETHRKCAKTSITTSTSGFKLDLYGEDIYQYANADILITYQATVNENAKVNYDKETNKATIQYSTAPGSTDMSDPKTDITYHYTFGFDTLVNGSGSYTTTEVTKYGIKTTVSEDNKVPLDGAEFQLFDAGGNLLYFTSEGKYDPTGTGVNHITSKNGGQLTVTGLDAGSYTLKESKAPLGYAKNKTSYTITISPTYNELTGELLKYTVTTGDGTNSIVFTYEKQDNGDIKATRNTEATTFAINNTPMIQLPETGGIGIVAITVAAVVLMVTFGSLLFVLRKKKNEK